MSREPIRSPCIRQCHLDPETRLCEGCARSLEEITGWARLTDAERDRIMADIPRRRAAMRAA